MHDSMLHWSLQHSHTSCSHYFQNSMKISALRYVTYSPVPVLNNIQEGPTIKAVNWILVASIKCHQ